MTTNVNTQQAKLVTFHSEIDTLPLKTILEANGLEVIVENRPNKPMASWEWLGPAAIVAFIAKPFFEKFLGELGTAAGKATLEAIKVQFSKAKQKNLRKVTSKDLREMKKLKERMAPGSEYHNIGQAIAPLEFRVMDIDASSIRLVFPSNIDESQIGDVVAQLADDPTLLENGFKRELVYQVHLNRWIEIRQHIMDNDASKKMEK